MISLSRVNPLLKGEYDGDIVKAYNRTWCCQEGWELMTSRGVWEELGLGTARRKSVGGTQPWRVSECVPGACPGGLVLKVGEYHDLHIRSGEQEFMVLPPEKVLQPYL